MNVGGRQYWRRTLLLVQFIGREGDAHVTQSLLDAHTVRAVRLAEDQDGLRINQALGLLLGG